MSARLAPTARLVLKFSIPPGLLSQPGQERARILEMRARLHSRVSHSWAPLVNSSDKVTGKVKCRVKTAGAVGL